MRLAHIFDSAALHGRLVDRTGDGGTMEVYPAAALTRWGFDISGYKSVSDRLRALAEAFFNRLPWLVIGPTTREACGRNDDLFDAVVSSLVARAGRLGHTDPPQSAAMREHARREGWIHVPSAESLQCLVGRRQPSLSAPTDVA